VMSLFVLGICKGYVAILGPLNPLRRTVDRFFCRNLGKN
jgi:hypothetical protein